MTALSTQPTRASPSAAHRSPAELPELSGYEILGLVGTGGMSTVYLARHETLDRLTAIKELSPSLAAVAGFAERFLRESRLAGNLVHPAIVTVHDYFESGGLPYISMEYLAGGSLRPRVTGRSLAEITDVLRSVLAALAFAHAHGVVHCDVKPENVLVTATGAVKLGDFGIARVPEDEAAPDGQPTGTLAYMAPERRSGAPVTPAVDVWAVGILAEELFVAAREPVGERWRAWARALRTTDPGHRPSAQAALDALDSLQSSARAGAPANRRRRLWPRLALAAAAAAAGVLLLPSEPIDDELRPPVFVALQPKEPPKRAKPRTARARPVENAPRQAGDSGATRPHGEDRRSPRRGTRPHPRPRPRPAQTPEGPSEDPQAPGLGAPNGGGLATPAGSNPGRRFAGTDRADDNRGGEITRGGDIRGLAVDMPGDGATPTVTLEVAELVDSDETPGLSFIGMVQTSDPVQFARGGPAKYFYVKADMGSGRTDFSYGLGAPQLVAARYESLGTAAGRTVRAPTGDSVIIELPSPKGGWSGLRIVSLFWISVPGRPVGAVNAYSVGEVIDEAGIADAEPPPED